MPPAGFRLPNPQRDCAASISRIAGDVRDWLDCRAFCDPRRPRRAGAASPWRRNQHVHDRVGIAREPELRAAARICRTGQCQEGGLRRSECECGSRLPRLLGEARARRGAVAQAVHEVARRIRRAVLQVVRGRRAQRLVQLSRPQPRQRQRGKGGDHLRGRRRRGDESHVPGIASSGLPARQRPEVAGHPQGRPRADLHADVDRGRGRDAGVRAHRRDAFGRVRGLLGEVAAGAHHRRRARSR